MTASNKPARVPRSPVLSWVYLALAAVGACGTWWFNLQFAAEHEGSFSVTEFVRSGFVNPGAGSLSVDILVAATVGIVFIVAESRRIGLRRPWVYVILAMAVAFAAAFPLFLFVRERHLAKPPTPAAT